MNEVAQIPGWLGAAVAGAVFAVLGYVGKAIVEAWRAARDTRRIRRAQLIDLQSLLRAAQVTFQIQNRHARRLSAMIQRDHSWESASGTGYEGLFAKTAPEFTSEEQELHSLIRSMTVHGLRPVNERLSSWLRQDVFYKGHDPSNREYGRLARLLLELESHLLLWAAKYEMWIPDNPDHALVYMADERKHGVGFPTDLDSEVTRVLGFQEKVKD